ncbi:MAG: CHAT domain-containing protein [Acidobacteriota bacterium]
MSKSLANRLIEAESAQVFLRELGRRADAQLFAALKNQADQLAYSDIALAKRLVEKIAQLAKLIKEPLAQAYADASRARLLHLLGQHKNASKFYQSAIRAFQKNQRALEAAIIQKQQVDTLAELGLYDQALRVAAQARRILKQKDLVQLAQLETNVGNVHYRLDRYRKALTHYDRAAKILSAVGDKRMLAIVDGNRSNIFAELDRPREAAALLEKTAKTFAKAGQQFAAAQARAKIAYLYFLLGNYNTALTSYYEIRDEMEALGENQQVAWCNLEIGEILLALNSFDDAMERATRAHDSFKAFAMPYEAAQALLICAFAAMGLKHTDGAQDYFIRARKVFSKSDNQIVVAQIDAYRAELALRQNDLSKAERLAAAAYRIFSQQKLLTKAAYARLLLARVAYQVNAFTKAKRLAKATLATIEKLFAPTIAYQAHHLIGKIESRQYHNREALQSFRRAIEIIERMRGALTVDEFKASFLRDKIVVYEDAINACLDEGSDAMLKEAFRLVESSKSRALADLIAGYLRDASQNRSSQKNVEQTGRAKLLKLIEELNWYNAQTNLDEQKGGQRKAMVAQKYVREIARCEKQITELFRKMEIAGSEFAEIHRMQALTAEEMSAVLDADEIAIEYFTTADSVSAFIASRDEIKLARHIAAKPELEALLASLRFQVEKFNYGAAFADEHFEQLNFAINQHLIEIYRKVFAAIEPHLNCEKLIIIPHDVLHYVPFHALLNRRGYLIERFEISYAPSATVLKLCRSRSQKNNLQLNVQNTNFNRQAFSTKSAIELVALGIGDDETPSIESEILALRKIFPQAVTLTGKAATRENLLRFAGRAEFLHLASHGYFRRDNPMFSFLQLADSPLNFYSLLDLKLRAEMVTLSACHTGMNMVFPGDELHGLMRGFLYAGAPTLVASLWAANDTSTSEFMREMYGQIQAGASKRAAIRAAQLAVKDAYGHPYYWAPFVLMGNPN